MTDADILAMEEVAGVPFPPIFRGSLMYKCLLMTDFGCDLFNLPETPSHDPLGNLWRYIGKIDLQPCFRQRRVATATTR